MRYYRAFLVGLACTVALAQGGPWFTQASTVPGTAVTISGLDDLTATAHDQARKGIGKMLGMGIGAAGLLVMAGGFPMTGGVVSAAGVGMAFVPGIISTAFDAAPASALLAMGAPSTLAGQWYAPLLALLYWPLLALRLLQDPVVLACAALAGLVRRARGSVFGR